MTVAEMFKQFIENLVIDNHEQISNRYGEITACLNKKYRNTESKTANSLKVGSYGRFTAIKGISDLDMIYIMPQSAWEKYKDGKQSALLQEVKNAIKDRYSRTQAWGDGQVVVVSFNDQEVEVLPAFEQADGSFKYPNTNNGGSWPITKPRSEIKAISDLDNEKNKNLRRLCKMVRAWKNQGNVVMSGILIDTLAYKFLRSTTDYDEISYLSYDYMARDFFKYVSELPDQEYFLAPGSSQRVVVKKKFQKKAKKAYNLCLEAIDAEGQAGVNGKWKKIFGRPFPATVITNEKADKTANISWNNTEEFIEDQYPVDIRYTLQIDCEVSQNGYREHNLSYMLLKHIPLFPKKKLLFTITSIDVPKPYQIAWKILNRGEVAKRRNEIRGQIVWDEGSHRKRENTKFRGAHLVECYAIKNGVVVAKGRIDVPIKTGE
ncbi:MAG: nucleotidyltransferase [Thermodesulfobacteriota bacterium]|nr:nucleotidyltransferase [Thermodesulfobacteriota bacterium]